MTDEALPRTAKTVPLKTVPSETVPAEAAHPEAPGRLRRKRWRWVALAFLTILLVDNLRPPADQLSGRALVAAIDLYQATLSPLMPVAGVHCRFEPTCSHYGEEAIRRHGAIPGSLRAGWRLLRCGPWTPDGTVDPP